jgi:3-deoxy-D-manno-octulosonic-acid transferase
MSHIFFASLLILSSLLRPIFSLLAVVLRPLVPFIKKRLDFERKNLLEESSLPFEQKNADFCFEISSEGELEQVRSLLEAALHNQKKVEIIYSSPSVENKCSLLYSQFPDQIRLLRLPLLSSAPISFLYFQSIWTWVSAPVIVFCRYDFFPELILLRLKSKQFILVSGALKKRSWYKVECLKFFDVIIAATENEMNNFKSELGNSASLYNCDFRIPRIEDRNLHANETLAKREILANYIEKLKSIAASKKLILGSAWVSDMEILLDARLIERVKKGDLHILLAPHKIDDESVRALKKKCEEIFGQKSVEVVDENNFYLDSNIVILQMGGILCELYSLFSLCYVGGGYERSIHSVLEPFFSNNIVITGPTIHRSTEIDVIMEIAANEIHVLNRPDSFYTVMESIDLNSMNLTARKHFLQQTRNSMSTIFRKILGL